MSEGGSLNPIALLRKHRAHFAAQAVEYQTRATNAPIREQEAAAEQARAYEKLVREIDATMRDWV